MLRALAAKSSCVAASAPDRCCPGPTASSARTRSGSSRRPPGRDRGARSRPARARGTSRPAGRGGGPDVEALAARLHLVFGFFARAVEHGASRAGDAGGRLEQQRGLADARLAAKENQGAGYDPAAQHAVKFVDARGGAFRLLAGDFGVEPGARARLGRVAVRDGGAGSSDTRSSTSEFHAPHSTQRPSHFCDCAPHSWQTKTVRGGFIWRLRGPGALQVLEARELPDEGQLHGPGRAVALLGDDEFRHP